MIKPQSYTIFDLSLSLFNVNKALAVGKKNIGLQLGQENHISTVNVVPNVQSADLGTGGLLRPQMNFHDEGHFSVAGLQVPYYNDERGTTGATTIKMLLDVEVFHFYKGNHVTPSDREPVSCP